MPLSIFAQEAIVYRQVCYLRLHRLAAKKERFTRKTCQQFEYWFCVSGRPTVVLSAKIFLALCTLLTIRPTYKYNYFVWAGWQPLGCSFRITYSSVIKIALRHSQFSLPSPHVRKYKYLVKNKKFFGRKKLPGMCCSSTRTCLTKNVTAL